MSTEVLPGEIPTGEVVAPSPAASNSGVVAAAVARPVSSSSSATWKAVRLASGRKMFALVMNTSAGSGPSGRSASMPSVIMPTLLPRSWVIIR